MSILLYYVTRNGHLGSLELPTFESCVPIPEDLLFVAYRDGINFVKEPPTKFPFSDVERLIMGSEFFDMRYLKDSDYRNQNTQICPYTAPTQSIFTITSVSGLDVYFEGMQQDIIDRIYTCGSDIGLDVFIEALNSNKTTFMLNFINFHYNQGNNYFSLPYPIDLKTVQVKDANDSYLPSNLFIVTP